MRSECSVFAEYAITGSFPKILATILHASILGNYFFYDTMRLIISMGKAARMMKSWITLTWTLTLSLHSLLSASAADRFPSLLLNTFFRNSHLLFHPLPTNSKTIVFSPAMGATLSMLPILILSRTIISPGLSTIKVTTTCT